LLAEQDGETQATGDYAMTEQTQADIREQQSEMRGEFRQVSKQLDRFEDAHRQDMAELRKVIADANKETNNRLVVGILGIMTIIAAMWVHLSILVSKAGG
jgi:hypothetical protein